MILFNGIFKHSGTEYVIEQISIDDRRIVLNLLAPTDITNEFFKELKEIIISLDNRNEKRNLSPLITTNETICILQLNIDFDKLLGNFNFKNLEKKLAKTASHGADVSIVPSSLRFKVNYDNIPANLVKNGITIANKQLLIELRDNTDPADKIYFTSSPTDSDTHLDLLKTIEKMFP